MIDAKQLEDMARECILEDWDAGGRYYRDMDLHRFAALVLERAAQTMPSTPEEISAFIGSNFCGVEYADPDMPAASQGDTYTLTAHDLLSAFDEWEAIRALKPKE